ncbi:MAG: DUF4332 domain-containing protein [Anaerolineae bacterium]|nr:DUF4332 domain-containing protein [Anaerolineae bacterium]
MAKRGRKKALRWLRRSILVPVVAGLLFWWWRRRTESQHSSDDAWGPEAIPLEHVLEEAEDLTRIGGIGPKVSQLLLSGGIATFGQLAATDIAELRRKLREAGLSMMDPSTWPAQAKLAAEGKWDELSDQREQLRGG